MGCKCGKNERQFVRLTEHNDHEGETWYFFLEYEGNVSNLIRLQSLIDLIDPDHQEYELDVFTLFSESTVDALVDNSPTGYMNTFNKVEGRMKDFLDSDIVEETPHYATLDGLYKGGIEDLFETEGLE